MDEQKKVMHLGIGKGDIGRYVFLPGSPERSEKIAGYFDNPKEIAFHREFRTFTGTLDGEPVAVTSSGIGGPSTAIAVEELVECGAHTIIRVGTCASTSKKVGIGDVVIPNGAVRMEGVGCHYLPLEFPSVPDFDLMKRWRKRPESWSFHIMSALRSRKPLSIHRIRRRQSRSDMN
ncbi:nucleoside phosphorylase [Clostridium sp. AM58-1XD]|uniref:nucleoside phosphorylase n=1 Tax=Clostridium sp. AM58-1XD TaxID=2292307 RepID=UPI0026CC1257